MTAVEWYEKEVNALIDKYEAKEISKSDFIVMKHNLFYPAKAMEKEHIVEAFFQGVDRESDGHGAMYLSRKDAEQYYNETFESE